MSIYRISRSNKALVQYMKILNASSGITLKDLIWDRFFAYYSVVQFSKKNTFLTLISEP